MVYCHLFPSRSVPGHAWGYSVCCSFWSGFEGVRKLPPGIAFYARGVYFWYEPWDDWLVCLDMVMGRFVHRRMKYDVAFLVWISQEWAALCELTGDVQYWSDVAVPIGFMRSFAQSPRFAKVLVMIDKLLGALGFFED